MYCPRYYYVYLGAITIMVTGFFPLPFFPLGRKGTWDKIKTLTTLFIVILFNYISYFIIYWKKTNNFLT